MKRYCLIGIKGIGKTSLIKSILPEISHIDYLIGSSILRDLVGPNFNNFDYFPEDTKQYYREQSILYMIERQKMNKKNILVDGHTSLYNPKTKKAEGVFTELDCKFFTDFILFEARPEVILERRKKDVKKERILDIEIIKQELKVEREESHKISDMYDIKMHYLMDDGTKNIGPELLKMLRVNSQSDTNKSREQ